MEYNIDKKIYIDKNEITYLEAMEGDTARSVTFQFFGVNTVLDLTNCKVRIYAINSKDRHIFNDLDILDPKKGIAKLNLTNALLTKGVTEYQLSISDLNGNILKSRLMNINVYDSLNIDDSIESSNEFTTLDNMLKDVTNIQLNINKANTNAQKALNTVNSVTDSVKEELKNIQTNLKNNINKDIKSLKQVKGVPANNLVCFIPPSTNRYLESFELIPEKGEMIAGYCEFDESVSRLGELKKFDYYTKEPKSYKEVDGIGHCNDLAYLPNTNELLVATMTGTYPSNLMILDYDTLEFKRWQPINGGSMTNIISGVAYNRDRDMVIVKAGDPNNIKLLDSNFNIIKEIAIPQTATFQSIASGGDYIYFNMNNIISVYNLETEEIVNYNYVYNGEPEGSAIDVNGNLFLSFCNAGTEWHCSTPRVFEIDFTQRATHGNLNSSYADFKNSKRIIECTQYLYLTFDGSNWNLTTAEGGKNIYGLGGNNFIETVKRNSSLDVKTRIGLLYALDGGVILECSALANYTAKNAGIDIIASYDRDKHTELDFFQNGKGIDCNSVPKSAGFRLKLSLGIHALT